LRPGRIRDASATRGADGREPDFGSRQERLAFDLQACGTANRNQQHTDYRHSNNEAEQRQLKKGA
jgi:hypothetical protein